MSAKMWKCVEIPSAAVAVCCVSSLSLCVCLCMYLCVCMYNVLVSLIDRASFLGISVVGQSNKAGDGGIYVGSIMKGSVMSLCSAVNSFLSDNLIHDTDTNVLYVAATFSV